MQVYGPGKGIVPYPRRVHTFRAKEIGAVIATLAAASAPKAHPTTGFAKEFIVPFWLVRSTGDKALANMDRSTIVCKLSIAAGKEENTCEPVLVPILHNTRPVKEGEELLTFDDQLVKATHSMEPIEAEVPAAARSPNKRAAVSAPRRLYQPQKEAMRS